MLARYLELILEYLLRRVGEQVLGWSLRQIIDYFRTNPEEGRACSMESIEKYTSEMETDEDPYFWERK